MRTRSSGSYVVKATILIGMSASAFLDAGAIGPASIILVSGGSSQTAIVGTTLPASLVAVVEDSSGKRISGAPVKWRVSKGNGSLSEASTTTDARGLANNTLTIGTL